MGVVSVLGNVDMYKTLDGEKAEGGGGCRSGCVRPYDQQQSLAKAGGNFVGQLYNNIYVDWKNSLW